MKTVDKTAVALESAMKEVAEITASIKDSEPSLHNARLGHAIGHIPFSTVNAETALMNDKKERLRIAEKQVADLTATIAESQVESK